MQGPGVIRKCSLFLVYSKSVAFFPCIFKKCSLFSCVFKNAVAFDLVYSLQPIFLYVFVAFFPVYLGVAFNLVYYVVFITWTCKINLISFGHPIADFPSHFISNKTIFDILWNIANSGLTMDEITCCFYALHALNCRAATANFQQARLPQCRIKVFKFGGEVVIQVLLKEKIEFIPACRIHPAAQSAICKQQRVTVSLCACSVVGWLIKYQFGILSLSCSQYSQTIC